MYGKLLKFQTVKKGIVRLDFSWEGPEPRPGQFFMVKARRSGVFLGRPISYAAYEKGDRNAKTRDKYGQRRSPQEMSFLQNNSLRFLIELKGRGTEELSALALGEEAEITGPLGNSWLDFLPKRPAAGEKGPAQQIALVGGGMGTAPLQEFTYYIEKKGKKLEADFFAGFKTGFKKIEEQYHLIGMAMFSARQSTVVFEDGRSGDKGVEVHKGLVTDYVKPEEYDAVYACGPEPMLRVLAAKCAAAGTPCFVSLERRMACGVGACLGCTVQVKGDETLINKRCCKDGPIFPAVEVFFD
jgi:NAD(P)H-flavin reductase